MLNDIVANVSMELERESGMKKADAIHQKVGVALARLQQSPLHCCQQNCLARLFAERESAVRVFLEEWYALDKAQQTLMVRLMVRLGSRWSEQTTRGLPRAHPRVSFSDPLFGPICRRAFARLLDMGEATLARHTAAVHASEGRFAPPVHANTGHRHHRIADEARHAVQRFLVDIAATVGEESAGRHRLRDEEEGSSEETSPSETPVIFLPAMYTLRLLYRLYRQHGAGPGTAPSTTVSWRTFCRIFHAPTLSWLRLRNARDDMCDVCLRYRRKMAQTMSGPENQQGLENLEEMSRVFVDHRDRALAARKQYRAACKQARDGAKRLTDAVQAGAGPARLHDLRQAYTAHYSFDFAQNLWLPQLADTPGQFYFLSLRSVILFGIVDDGGDGAPQQVNMLYDQTTAGKGSSEVVSMLYRFLVKDRNPGYASPHVSLHADNCVGQNKNSTVVHFLLWCVATGLLESVEMRFLVTGHTKFSPDGGFGLIKRQYCRANIYTIHQVARAVQDSTVTTQRNTAIILERNAFGDWKSALRQYFLPFKGVAECAAFRFHSSYALGEFQVQGHDDDTWKSVRLLQPRFRPQTLLTTPEFLTLSERLPALEAPTIPTKKQWELYEKVRPYVPAEYQDVVCPHPNVSKISSSCTGAPPRVEQDREDEI